MGHRIGSDRFGLGFGSTEKLETPPDPTPKPMPKPKLLLRNRDRLQKNATLWNLLKKKFDECVAAEEKNENVLEET